MVGYPNLSAAGGPDGPIGDRLKVISEALIYEGRVYIPVDGSLRNKVISLFHDNSESG